MPAPNAPVSASGPPAVAPSADPRGRTFPCPTCGADLVFSIGAQRLACPHCGSTRDLSLEPGAQIVEQDLLATLARLESGRAGTIPNAAEIQCRSCAATVEFTGTLTSTECAFCGTPIQREDIHQAEARLTVDGVLAFRIDHDRAAAQLRRWVESRWFAPGEFKRRGVRGRFVGVYLPFWTFDAMTATSWRGQRGDAYYVEVRSGNNRRRERRVNWTRVAGAFQSFFDDVVVAAANALPSGLVQALEPWPLGDLRPFSEELLAGLQARTYDRTLGEGFADAKTRIEASLRGEVRRRIGGDEQRIEHLDVRYDALTYKHILLPLWLLTYRFGDKPYHVAVNATTGEIVGQRPWSVVKIAFAVFAVLCLLLLVFVLGEAGGG